MVYAFVLGGFIAYSLLVLFFYFSYRGKKTTNGFAKMSPIGVCPSNTGKRTDIVIVGAGVAGAALAYTLGKVLFPLMI